MLRRLIVALLLVLPLAAHADDAATQTTTQSNSTLQQTGDSASAPQTVNLIQPQQTGSDAASLQSANASSAGLVPSTGQDIQQKDASNQAKLLVQGDADSPHSLGNEQGITWLGYAALILLAATAITAALWLWQRRRAS